MASVLRKLSDEALERVHHMIRRDAMTDLAIAREAERLHGEKLWETDTAAERAVGRYRDGAQYRGWLKRWQNQDAELRSKIEVQKQRFEFLSSLVKDPDDSGLYDASKHLQARLLTIAAEMSDEELKAGDVKWLRTLLREIREAEKMDREAMAAKAEDVAGDKSLSEIERRRRIREIFQVAEK